MTTLEDCAWQTVACLKSINPTAGLPPEEYAFFLMADANDPRARKRSLPDATLPKVTEIHANQSSVFGILRRPRVDSDRISEARQDEYANGMIGRLGLNAALARRARTDAGDIWVIPGKGFICLDVGGMCCNTSEVARAQGMVTWTSARSDDSTIVHGLVPDGVKEVVLTATDGTTKTVPVKDNVYGTQMQGVFMSLRFAGPHETVKLGPWR